MCTGSPAWSAWGWPPGQPPKVHLHKERHGRCHTRCLVRHLRDVGDVVARYLRGLHGNVRGAIEVVSIDPYEPYRQPIRAELPGARIVADRFHLVRVAKTALDAARRGCALICWRRLQR